MAVATTVEVAAGVKGLSTNNFWNPAIEPLNHTELFTTTFKRSNALNF